MLFNKNTGEIPHAPTRIWDAEQNTLSGAGVEANRPTVTGPHGITGSLIVDQQTGKAIGVCVRACIIHTHTHTDTHSHSHTHTHTLSLSHTHT